MTFSISALPAKRSTKSSAIVFDRRRSQFARAASRIFRSPKMASGSPTGEPALDLTTQHSVIRPPLPAALVDLDHSPSTRRRCSSRISSAMLVRDNQTLGAV